MANATAVVVWLLCGTAGYLIVIETVTASFFEGRYYPVYGDSFYHASRILDVYRDSLTNFHFDPNLNAPEGMWISWPWLYDTTIAYLLKIRDLFGVRYDVEYFLFGIPSWWIYVNLGLALVLLSRLRVNIWLAAPTVLCLAATPAMMLLHSFGRVDHHFMELTMLLLTAVLTVGWLHEPGSRSKAMLCGAALGIAPAIHNGLFVLHLPLLATLFVSWVNGRETVDRTAALYFAAASCFTLFMLLLFSEPFRRGMFAFYHFGWFHLYVAAASALLVVYFSRFVYSVRKLPTLIILCLAIVAPLANAVLSGYEWMDAEIAYLSSISEMRPLIVPESDWQHAALRLLRNLGAFAVMLPAALAAAVYFIARSADDDLVFISFTFLLAAVLWMHQQRFEYFGVPALFLFTATAVDLLIKRIPSKVVARTALTAVVSLCAASVPLLAHSGLTRPRPSMGMQDYPLAVKLLNDAMPLCESDPGILLVETHFGHLARYLTRCPVMSTMMLITPQDFNKIREVERLLDSTPEAIYRNLPEIKYVLVMKSGLGVTGRKAAGSAGELRLVRSLLDTKAGPPEGIETIRLMEVNSSKGREAYGGLFRFAR